MSDGEFQIPADIWPNLSMKEQEVLSRLNWEQLKGKPMTGIELIAQERLEQKVKHGRSVKYDAQINQFGELKDAAVALIEGDIEYMPAEWDQTICNYMMRKSLKERLIIAGALIAAELDRLNFKE